MKKNIIVFIIIFFITIGFATVNTVLDFDGKYGIGFNFDDFNVVISKIEIDGKDYSENISVDKQSFRYVGNGDNKIKYRVMNKSYQYDVKINLVCNPSNDVVIEQIDLLEAQRKKDAIIESKTEMEVICKLEVEKLSRTEIAESMCQYEDGASWDFTYTGKEEIFFVPCDGLYKIELWGAQGENYGTRLGGKGAYTSGEIDLLQKETLKINVGGQGGNTDAGYNGGGRGGAYTTQSSWIYAGGGGSTDVRYSSSIDATYEQSLRDRIMVASGGGGASYYNNGSSNDFIIYSGSSFYKGNDSGAGGGGGGGYFGGTAGTTDYAGSGGTSFVSGYYKTLSVQKDSDILSTSSKHFSGKTFTNSYIESDVQSGNGKVKITFLGFDKNNEEVIKEYDYPFNLSYHIFEVPQDGYYEFELMGAQGGNYGSIAGGKGGLVSGTIKMYKNEKYLLYVGGQGGNTAAGYNGGGSGGAYTGSQNWVYAGGGGSTDIRVLSSNTIPLITDEQSLRNRIMVAGGGGGAGYYNSGSPGGHTRFLTSSFYNGISSSMGGGGGSGYFGGTAGPTDYAGSGGTSYVSGYYKTMSVAEDENKLMSTSTHYSNKVFENVSLIEGENIGNGKIKIKYIGDTADISELDTFEYEYNSSFYSFEVKKSGKYKVELYGAQGGNYGSIPGGKGAYTAGIINLDKGEKFLLYIGGQGGNTTPGYNGGGSGGAYTGSQAWIYAGGGGSTDIRTIYDMSVPSINDSVSLENRIMVAAGGGGASYYNGGGLGSIQPTTSSFYNGISSSMGGGGGSGYFGGSAGSTDYAGQGGSCFVSGNSQTLSILPNSQTLSDSSNHFSGKIFNDSNINLGNRQGNGYAKITYIGE